MDSIPSTITRDISNMLYAVLLPNYHSTFYYLYLFELFVYQSSVNIGIYKFHMIGLLCSRRRNVSTRSFLGTTSENRRGRSSGCFIQVRSLRQTAIQLLTAGKWLAIRLNRVKPHNVYISWLYQSAGSRIVL